MTLDLVYAMTLALFFTHELDAVKRHEWRLLPLVRSLPDRVGEQVFIWLHAPIFALLLLGGDGEDVNVVRVTIAGFAIFHVGLHWMFRNHPANELATISSWALILGTGVAGAAFLIASVVA